MGAVWFVFRCPWCAVLRNQKFPWLLTAFVPRGQAGRGRRAGTDFYLPFKDPYGKYKLVAAGKSETIGIQGIAHLNSWGCVSAHFWAGIFKNVSHEERWIEMSTHLVSVIVFCSKSLKSRLLGLCCVLNLQPAEKLSDTSNRLKPLL